MPRLMYSITSPYMFQETACSTCCGTSHSLEMVTYYGMVYEPEQVATFISPFCSTTQGKVGTGVLVGADVGVLVGGGVGVLVGGGVGVGEAVCTSTSPVTGA